MSFWRKNHKSTNLNTKNHYKMYKAGKQWLFAGITTVAGLGGQSIAGAKADSLSATSTATKDVQDQDVLATGDSAIIPAESSVASSSVATASTTSAALSSASSAVSSSDSSNTSSASSSSADTSSSSNDSSSAVSSASSSASSATSNASSSADSSSSSAGSSSVASSVASSAATSASSSSSATSSSASSTSNTDSGASSSSITSNAVSSATSGSSSGASLSVGSAGALASSSATLSASSALSLATSSIAATSSVAASSSTATVKLAAKMMAAVAALPVVNTSSMSYQLGVKIATLVINSWMDQGLSITQGTWLSAHFVQISQLISFWRSNGDTILDANGLISSATLATNISDVPNNSSNPLTWSTIGGAGFLGIGDYSVLGSDTGYTQNGGSQTFSATDYSAGLASILNDYANQFNNYLLNLESTIQNLTPTSGSDIGTSIPAQVANFTAYNPSVLGNGGSWLSNVFGAGGTLVGGQNAPTGIWAAFPSVFQYKVTSTNSAVVSALTAYGNTSGSINSLNNLMNYLITGIQNAIEAQLLQDVRTLGVQQAGAMYIP